MSSAEGIPHFTDKAGGLSSNAMQYLSGGGIPAAIFMQPNPSVIGGPNKFPQ